MTHEELIDAIDRQIVTAPPFALGGYTRFLHALSAVVELHTPDYDEVVGDVCGQCSEGEYWNPYPCLTIQAIEEKLK